MPLQIVPLIYYLWKKVFYIQKRKLRVRLRKYNAFLPAFIFNLNASVATFQNKVHSVKSALIGVCRVGQAAALY